jgi:uncharacterized protein (DUF488 family)
LTDGAGISLDLWQIFEMGEDAALLVLTVGHSTHPVEEFLEILTGHGVCRLVDVRTIPRSRTNPQFNKESLPSALASAGIHYTHMPGLGGLRKANGGLENAGWRNASFRGYADYMQTNEFRENLAALIDLASKERVAIMCAEAVPWRCHRSLIADALVIRGVPVEDILSRANRKPHALTSFAHVEGKRITYPALPAKGENQVSLL